MPLGEAASLMVHVSFEDVAAKMKRIRLTGGVTVLGSEDAVRVFQDFATLDLLSGGRAAIIAGRGSFTKLFPLFGNDVAEHADLSGINSAAIALCPDNKTPCRKG
ncbi:LLM class flavin-dependent oxidoreductase [Nonomuraea sp. CA-141351]|uniref:LLM class flavin-dependent oxidoreductase n=1 Tax=Nonomuraea sp. CA-141351 TaxID=3239996 RepID=UPI003D919300